MKSAPVCEIQKLNISPDFNIKLLTTKQLKEEREVSKFRRMINEFENNKAYEIAKQTCRRERVKEIDTLLKSVCLTQPKLRAPLKTKISSTTKVPFIGKAVTLNKMTEEEALIIEGIMTVDDKIYIFTSVEVYYTSRDLLDKPTSSLPKSMYLIEELNDLVVEFDVLTRIIKFKIPLKIRKVRHNTFSILSSLSAEGFDLELIDEHTNIRKELSLSSCSYV